MEILKALYYTATFSFWILLFAYFLINMFNIKDNRYIKRHQIMLCLAINEILTIPYLISANNYFSLILEIIIIAMWTYPYLKDRKYI